MKSVQFPSRRQHRGVALIVVLLLLLVMTLLGLASLRSTLLQERMGAALFDRSIAFQAAESALREAEIFVAGQAVGSIDPLLSGAAFDCRLNARCESNPFITAPVGVANSCAFNAALWRTATTVSNLQSGTPQFCVEYIGERTTDQQMGQQGNLNANQYGGTGGGVVVERIYRIYARSANITTVNDRASALLLSTFSIRI
jgi:type IV pilus assembly protein PilX